MGFECGGENFREIIFFQDEKTLAAFKHGNDEPGARASAVAFRKGASKNIDFDKDVAVFTQTSGGLMFDVSVGAAVRVGASRAAGHSLALALDPLVAASVHQAAYPTGEGNGIHLTKSPIHLRIRLPAAG